jgi:hypothetical protein
MIYTVTRPLSTNQEVHGVKAILIANSSASGGTAELYTTGITGASASSKIYIPATDTKLFPIQIVGASFGNTISVWALS